MRQFNDIRDFLRAVKRSTVRIGAVASPPEVAEAMGVTRQQVANLARQGAIAGWRFSGHSFVDLDSVVRYLKARNDSSRAASVAAIGRSKGGSK